MSNLGIDCIFKRNEFLLFLQCPLKKGVYVKRPKSTQLILKEHMKASTFLFIEHIKVPTFLFKKHIKVPTFHFYQARPSNLKPRQLVKLVVLTHSGGPLDGQKEMLRIDEHYIGK